MLAALLPIQTVIERLTVVEEPRKEWQLQFSIAAAPRSGDVVATADGLVAYTGVRLGADQAPDFAPVADYPGLTASVRAKLGEMKVAPASADMLSEAATSAARVAPDNAVQAATTPKAKHTIVN